MVQTGVMYGRQLNFFDSIKNWDGGWITKATRHQGKTPNEERYTK